MIEIANAEEALWEQRRYEIAKEIAPIMWLDDGQAQRFNEAQGHLGFEYKNDRLIAKEAIQFADALIAQLKSKKQ